MNKAYTSYVPINQKWAKQIPSHWDARRMKAVFAMRKERNNPIVTENILSLTAKQGVVPYAEKEGTGGNKPKSDLTKYNVCHENDLLVNCMNVVSGAAGVSRYYGAISPVYYAFYPHKDENIWYYHYIFRLLPFQRSLVGLGKGILMHESEDGTLTSVRMRISMDYLGNVLLPVPPREEQDQIVRFLDWKVSSINKLINIKKKEIKAINALKRSIISHVITHGLMPDVPMKYSGVRWLGDIPAHWQTIKLKRVTKVRNEKGIYTPNSEDKYIGLENIKGYSNNISITSSEHDVSVQCICHSGDLMFSKLRPYLAKTVIVPYNCFCTGEMMVISAFIGDMRFLRYVMLHERFIDSVNSSTYGAKMPRANSSYILNMQVPIPQVDEQQKIADYIDEKVLQIDMATKKYEQIIDDLQVLKTRLISDTVTGKIDVRGIEIPEYEFMDEDIDNADEIMEQGVNEPLEEE